MEITNSQGLESTPQTASILGQLLNTFFTLVFFLIICTFTLAFLYWLYNKLKTSKHINDSLNREDRLFLQVKIPPTNENKEDSMVDFLHTVHNLLPNNAQFSLELSSLNQFLIFNLAILPEDKNALETQLYAQYPDAEVEQVQDPLPNFENASIIELYFKHTSSHPIKTYKDLDEDFLKSFSALLSKTEPGEQIYLQFSLKRVGSKLLDRGLQASQQKWFGKKFDSDNNPTPQYSKLSHDLFLGKLRLIYVSKDKATAEGKLKTLSNVFKALKSSQNELKARKLSPTNSLYKILKARVIDKGSLWTPSEIATIYHYPYKGSVVSNVVRSTSKYAPAPDNLPYEGLIDEKEVSFFGETNYRNEKRKFGLKRIDRRRHLYVVGKTGSGKSRLLQLLLISDILSNQGCCLLDPHGDLADELLMFVPRERIKDVVYVNPTDKDFPIGFNPLEPVKDYETRQHLSTFFIAIFKRLFAATWNQRMEHLVRYITLALLETPDSNILGISRILSDTAFRQRVVMQIQDPVVKAFWTNEFGTWNQLYSSEAIVPILNKIGQFTANPIVRNMIGQRRNALDFEKFMNEGKIVIINVSKGKLGEENSALLGSMFITKIQQAALARAKMAEDDRRDFYFYVDEFQNFATDAFSSILSEARKYHLDLTIAHQYIAQLPEEVKATAFGNVGTIIVFPIGGDDAAYLSKEFTPTFTADDMINLNLREMYIKMSVDGRITPPFSARTINVPTPKQDFSQEIVDNSRLTYSKNRIEVENEIKRWTESTQPIDTPSNSSDEFPEPII